MDNNVLATACCHCWLESTLPAGCIPPTCLLEQCSLTVQGGRSCWQARGPAGWPAGAVGLANCGCCRMGGPLLVIFRSMNPRPPQSTHSNHHPPTSQPPPEIKIAKSSDENHLPCAYWGLQTCVSSQCRHNGVALQFIQACDWKGHQHVTVVWAYGTWNVTNRMPW